MNKSKSEFVDHSLHCAITEITCETETSQASGSHDFQSTAQYLLEELDQEPSNYLARLGLAQCYVKLNQPFAAIRAFQYITKNCPDPHVQDVAKSMLCDLNEQVDALVRRNLESRFGGLGH